MIGASIFLGLIIALVVTMVISVQKFKKKRAAANEWLNEVGQEGYLPDFVETDLH